MDIASIPGRVFAFITVRRTTVVRLTVIKAKTWPGIEATNGYYSVLHAVCHEPPAAPRLAVDLNRTRSK